MPAYVALLRAVNVGGTGKLPMTTLTNLSEKAGFANVQTYIASGNVVFESKKGEAAVKAALESALERYAGKPVSVFVRTAGGIWANFSVASVAMPNVPSDPTKSPTRS